MCDNDNFAGREKLRWVVFPPEEGAGANFPTDKVSASAPQIVPRTHTPPSTWIHSNRDAESWDWRAARTACVTRDCGKLGPGHVVHDTWTSKGVGDATRKTVFSRAHPSHPQTPTLAHLLQTPCIFFFCLSLTRTYASHWQKHLL